MFHVLRGGIEIIRIDDEHVAIREAADLAARSEPGSIVQLYQGEILIATLPGYQDSWTGAEAFTAAGLVGLVALAAGLLLGF